MNIAQLQALFLKPIPRQTSVLALILWTVPRQDQGQHRRLAGVLTSVGG